MMPRRTPWWVFACAASFVAYFGLLVYCDMRRPEPEGLAFAFDGGLTVREVWRSSAADRAGLRAGDVIASVDGQALTANKMDWVAVTTNVEFDRPLRLVVRRDGREVRLALELRRSPHPLWATREGLDLLGVRAVQLAALALGLVLLFRRPSDPVARLGAWLQGSLAVFCVVLPFRIAAVWRSLWWPAGALLWLPFASSLLLGALLLTFFLEFPVRRIRPAWWLAAIWAPLALAAAPFLRFHLHVVYLPATALAVDDGLPLLLSVSTVYLAATVAAAAWSYRRLRDEDERRRLRVLFAGAVIGCAATGPIVVGWWQTGTLALFGGRTMAWLAPLLVTVPVSLAYAILRHRLFDLRLIVRRGVQYALARRLLVSLVPALLLAMIVDLYLHRAQPMGEVVAARASVYLLLSAAALVARFQRQRWLEILDRRFFRERYDAQRILRRVAEEVSRGGSLEQVGDAVVSQVEVALHPRFVALLVKAAGAEWFRPLAAAPRGLGPDRLPASARVAAIARLLGRPLEVSTRETAPFGQQLPAEELALLREAGLELLVPIGGEADGREALLALGARRSDEPYAREDEDLLQAIAGTLGLLMARDHASGTAVPSMRECPRCGACADETSKTCPADGSPLAVVRLPRTLVARYRLERRLGRGGMGTVYSAADLTLHRTVAVKVLRDDLAADPEAAGRFEREARTAAALSHPNVVTIHDFGLTVRGRGFLVMEQLEGRTLRDVLESEGPLPPARVLDVLIPVCAAVDAAHRRQLVHRDLKPENVFLSRVEGREIPKILDFGIAKAFRPATAGLTRDTAGVMLGTPEYMAPEQLRGEAAGPAWDVWALAVLAFEMLTGAHPFECTVRHGGTAPAGLAGATLGPGGSLDALGGGCAAFFAGALAVDPGARPATAAEFSAGLERSLAGRGQP